MTDVTSLPASSALAALVDCAAAEPATVPVSPARTALRRDAAVRALEARDIPAICDLFAATFRPGRGLARAAVERSLAETYLTSPGDRVRPASRVYIGAAGSVDGFMGVITLEARFRGRPLTCGILGNFMGREADRARAGLKLSRATFALDLDLMFSDTASRGSVELSRSFGFDVLPAHSLGWKKVLRPCAFGAARLGRRAPRFAACTVHPLADEQMAAQIRPLLDRYALRPLWDNEELGWLLGGARRRAADGALQAREVSDRRGRTIGIFLLHARPGSAARVLQVLAERGREPAVMAAVIREAAAIGATAVGGRMSPTVSAGLLWQRGIVYRRAPAAIGFARDPAVHAALQSDSACLGGLFGETWTLPDSLG